MRDCRDTRGSRAEGRGSMLPFDKASITAITRVKQDVPADLLAEPAAYVPEALRKRHDHSPAHSITIEELNHTDWQSFKNIAAGIAHLRTVQNLPSGMLAEKYSIPDDLERNIAPESGQLLFVVMRRGLPMGLALGRLYEPSTPSSREPDEEDQEPRQEINVTLLHALLRGKGIGKLLIDHLKSQNFSRISFDLPALPEPIAFLRRHGAMLSAKDQVRLGDNPSPEAIMASRKDKSSVRMYIPCPA